MNVCDGGHDATSEIRKMPSGHGNLLVCRRCYLKEIRFRRERNEELDEECKFSLPAWRSLELVSPSVHRIPQ